MSTQFPTRREFLADAGGGLGMLALGAIVAGDANAAAAKGDEPLAPKKPHFQPRARRVLWLFMHGGPSRLAMIPMKCSPIFLTSFAAVHTLVFFLGSLAIGADGPSDEIPVPAKPGIGANLSGELIYPLEERPTPQCHASTIAETPTGLVAAWFGGKHEKNPDVGIWVSRQEDGTWSKPFELANGVQSEQLRYPCWNPVLFFPMNGPLLLFYKVGSSPSQWWGMLMTSDDDGKTWSEPRKLGENDRIGHLLGPVKNKPIQLADGSILCPSSTEHRGWRVHFERTKDLGQSWEVIGPINDGEKFAAIQPSILTYSDGKMQVICRSRQGVLAQSWSTDGGKTWSAMTAMSLPNPNAGTDAVTLADGRQLLVYNHTTRGGGFPSGRNMLNVAISNDGKDWRPVLTLERDQGEFSYPAVIQTSGGKVHVTYTFQRQSVKHVVLDPEKLQ